MNFEHIRTIIKNIKEQVTCQQCHANFLNEDINVVSLNNDQCVLAMQCHECNTPIMITASLSNGKVMNNAKEDIIAVLPQLQDVKEYSDTEAKVVIDDVLNVHETLKDFSGNISDMFKKE